MDLMVQALRLLFGISVVASLAVIVISFVGFAAVAVFTMCKKSQPDLLAEELDEALAQILASHEERPPMPSNDQGGQSR